MSEPTPVHEADQPAELAPPAHTEYIPDSSPSAAAKCSIKQEILQVLAYLALVAISGVVLSAVVVWMLGAALSMGAVLYGAPDLALFPAFVMALSSRRAAYNGGLGVVLLFYAVWTAVTGYPALSENWTVFSSLASLVGGLILCRGWLQSLL